MRHDSPFLVKRYASMIGRPDSPRRVTVAACEYTLEDALATARRDRSQRALVGRTVRFDREGGVELYRFATLVEAAGVLEQACRAGESAELLLQVR